MTRISLMIDLDACIGCKSCEAACKQEHGLGPHTFRNQVLWLANNSQPELAFPTVTCQHCVRPACLRACPVNPKVITKDPETGVVAVDTDRCTGCDECVKACPYGATRLIFSPRSLTRLFSGLAVDPAPDSAVSAASL